MSGIGNQSGFTHRWTVVLLWLLLFSFPLLAANTDPVLTLDNTTLNYTENDGPTQIDAAAVVNDADGDADWDGGVLTLQITANYEASDNLSIPNNVVGSINVSGFSIRDGSTVFGVLTYDPGFGPKFIVTLNSNATNLRVQQLVQSVSFNSNSENPGTANRTVTITATDKNGAMVSDTRDISITRKNDAPSIASAIADTTVIGNFSPAINYRDLNDVFTDIDGDALTFSVMSLKGFITPTINGADSMLVLTAVNNASGIDTLIVKAKDASDSVMDTVQVTITQPNQPPTVVGPMPNTTRNEDFSPINYRDLNTVFTDPESGSALTFTARTLQNRVDLLIKESDSVLVIIAKKDVYGIDTIIVTASDGEYSVDDSVIITINPLDDVPSIVSPIPDTTVIEDFTPPINYRDLNAVFTDVDSDALTFSVVSISGKVTPTINGADSMLVLTTVADAHGIDTVIVSASDGKSTSKDTVFVTITPVNDPPTIGSATAQTMPEDSLLTIKVTMTDAADVDEDILQIILGTGANYTVGWDTVYVDENFIGTLTVPVAVTDSYDTTAFVPMTITVTAKDDTPVVVTPFPDTIVLEDFETFLYGDLNTVFNDEESGSALTFSVRSTEDLVVPTINSIDSTLSIAAVANLNGRDTVLVTASDGNTAVTDTFVVTIAPVNDAPTMSVILPQTINEDNPLVVKLSMTNAVDIDNTLSDASLIIESGSNYSVSGNSIRPAENWSGILTVPVKVSDGLLTTGPVNMSVTVDPVNDAPTITTATPQTTNEDTPITLTLAMTDAADVDNVLTDESLIVEGGFNYTVSGRVVTPAPDFVGKLIVPLKVTDGLSTSFAVNMTITVTDVNDPPVITYATPQTILEDEQLTVLLSMTDATDADYTLSDESIILEPGSNYSIQGRTVIPAPDWNGVLTVPVKVTDNIDTSDAATMTVTVTPVNDPPLLSGITTQTIDEDTPLTVDLSMIQVTDVDNTLADEGIMLGAGSLYTVVGRTITPLENFYGTLTIPVTVSDGNSSSATVNMSVIVQPVNDAPTLTSVDAQTIAEDTPLKVLLSFTDARDIDNLLSNDNVVVDPGEHYTVEGSTITPAQDFVGVLTVPVRVSDGAASSAAVIMTVTVTAVNDAPTMTTATTQTIAEEASLTILLAMTDAADVDNTLSEESLIVGTGENYTISGNTITPALNFNGTLSVPLRVTDGTELSNTITVSVIVTPVNDAPTVTMATTQTVAEDTPLTITVEMTDAADVDGDLLAPIIEAGENYTVLGTTITPALNFFGTLTLPVKVTDGTVTTEAVSMTVTVTPVNDAPTVVSATAQEMIENTSLTITLAMVEGEADIEGSPLSITLGTGENFTTSGDIVTPTPEFTGTILVPVMVNDGELNSTPVLMSIFVDRENTAPVLLSVDPFAMVQDVPRLVSLTDIIATDGEDDPLTLIIAEGVNYTVSGTTIIPAAGFVGVLSVPFSVFDGRDVSNVITKTIRVKLANTNAVPFVAGARLTLEKNRTLTLTAPLVNATDSDDDGLRILPNDGTNYSVHKETIIPVDGFVGVLMVPLRATDGIDTSSYANVEIVVFQKKIGFHIGQVIVSDTFTVSVLPNPVPLDAGELYIGAPQEVFDELRVAIYSHTADLMVQGDARVERGQFIFRWDFSQGRQVLGGYSYLALLSFVKDGVVVKEEKKMIGIVR